MTEPAPIVCPHEPKCDMGGPMSNDPYPPCHYEEIARNKIALAGELSKRARELQAEAVKLCPHTQHEVNGGHAYCTTCSKHLGDPCVCGNMKRWFGETCAKCGAW